MRAKFFKKVKFLHHSWLLQVFYFLLHKQPLKHLLIRILTAWQLGLTPGALQLMPTTFQP
jgi:hypothetical protein